MRSLKLTESRLKPKWGWVQGKLGVRVGLRVAAVVARVKVKVSFVFLFGQGYAWPIQL